MLYIAATSHRYNITTLLIQVTQSHNNVMIKKSLLLYDQDFLGIKYKLHEYCWKPFPLRLNSGQPDSIYYDKLYSGGHTHIQETILNPCLDATHIYIKPYSLTFPEFLVGVLTITKLILLLLELLSKYNLNSYLCISRTLI